MNKFFVLSIGFTLFFVFGTFDSAYGAIYLKIPDIDGEATTAGHEKWIELTSLSDVVNRDTKNEKAGTADIDIGVGQIAEIISTKSLDVSSTFLAQAATNGNSLGDIKICLSEPAQGGCYKTYDLARAFVKSWSISSQGDERPTEQVSFYFNSIRMIHYDYDGKEFKETSRTEWDFVTNTPTYSGHEIAHVIQQTTPKQDESAKEMTPKVQEIPDKSQEIKVPVWIKTPVGFWSEGQTTDTEFRDSIQFMIKEKLIVVPQTEVTESQTETTIPAWVKGMAGFWSKGQTTDTEFVNGLQFLISKNIIKVNDPGQGILKPG